MTREKITYTYLIEDQRDMYQEYPTYHLETETYDNAKDFIKKCVTEDELNELGYFRKLPNNAKAVELDNFMLVSNYPPPRRIDFNKITAKEAREIVNGQSYLVRQIDMNSLCPELIKKASDALYKEQIEKKKKEDQKKEKKLEAAKRKLEKLETEMKVKK